MRKNTFYFLFLFILAGCHNRSFTIEGTLPSHRFDGEWVFLVPVEDADYHTVDSVKITNAKFTFNGNVERMSIIRTRPLLRLTLQELLVVTEPGTIKVRLDSVSSASGTKQNEALQHWKDAKDRNMEAYRFLRKGMLAVPGKDSLRWKAQLDALMLRDKQNNESFVRTQGNNTVGIFVRKMTGQLPR